MMKVTVLPTIPFKEAVCTSHLICYETFSTIMPLNEASRSARKSLQQKAQVHVYSGTRLRLAAALRRSPPPTSSTWNPTI